MKLHEEAAAFDAITQRIADRTGINPSIIEKDYYVSMVLQEIGARQNAVPAFFKGGTCLYKIYLDMKRFSEDIDLTVKIDNLSNSQAKRMLEKATQNYECMHRLKGDPLEENRKGSITTVYGYDPIYEIDLNDRLQRYGKLKIEATSFTISEPYETNKTASLIFQYATEEEKNILQSRFGLEDFFIQNISIERMFADKILAAEFYLERGEYFDVAKHLYDLNAMLTLPRIQTLMSEDERFIRALSYKREEETLRIGSDLAEKPLKDLLLFSPDIKNNKELAVVFQEMQRVYIIHERDRLTFADCVCSLDHIKENCLRISDREEVKLRAQGVNPQKEDTLSKMEQIWNAFFIKPKEEKKAHPIEWEGKTYSLSVFEDKYLSECQKAGVDPDKAILKHFNEVCIDMCGYEPKFYKENQKDISHER